MKLPKCIIDAVERFSDLPGVGSRSAERLVFHLLRTNSGLEKRLANALITMRETVQECSQCHTYSENTLCQICNDTTRNMTTLCVVENPLDMLAIERTHAYKGQYHVLHGVLSPMHKTGVEDLRIASLLGRIEKTENTPTEVILALGARTEGEATALYLIDQIQKMDLEHITISRLSRGIPLGGEVEYLDAGTLSRSLQDRRSVAS